MKKLINKQSALAGALSKDGLTDNQNPYVFNITHNYPICKSIDVLGFYKAAIQGAGIALSKNDPEIMRAAGSILFRSADAMVRGNE